MGTLPYPSLPAGHDDPPGLPAPPGRRGLQGHEQRGAEAQAARRLPAGPGQLPEDLRPPRRRRLEEEEARLPGVLTEQRGHCVEIRNWVTDSNFDLLRRS